MIPADSRQRPLLVVRGVVGRGGRLARLVELGARNLPVGAVARQRRVRVVGRNLDDVQAKRRDRARLRAAVPCDDIGLLGAREPRRELHDQGGVARGAGGGVVGRGGGGPVRGGRFVRGGGAGEEGGGVERGRRRGRNADSRGRVVRDGGADAGRTRFGRSRVRTRRAGDDADDVR